VTRPFTVSAFGDRSILLLRRDSDTKIGSMLIYRRRLIMKAVEFVG